MTTDPEEPGLDGKCGARKRDGSGGHCTQTAGWGTDHVGIGKCRKHGGSTKNHVASAKTEMARLAVATYGLPREVDPAVALLEEVHRSAGHVAWLQQKVAELDDEALVWGVTEEVNKTATEFSGIDVTSAAKPNVWLELYHRERKHLTDVCKAALAAGIAERQVRLAEQQGALLVGVIQRILDDLALTAEQRELVPTVVPRHLRAVS